MIPTMCQIVVVTQLNLKNAFVYEIGLIARCRHRSMKSSSMEGQLPA